MGQALFLLFLPYQLGGTKEESAGLLPQRQRYSCRLPATMAANSIPRAAAKVSPRSSAAAGSGQKMWIAHQSAGKRTMVPNSQTRMARRI